MNNTQTKKSVNVEDVKLFYNRLTNFEKSLNGCNFKYINRAFSKNYFISNCDELILFTINNQQRDVYMTYNGLKTANNRKTINIKSYRVIALDVECSKKTNFESSTTIKKQERYILKFIKNMNITNYMLVFSGNGFHRAGEVRVGSAVQR